MKTDKTPKTKTLTAAAIAAAPALSAPQGERFFADTTLRVAVKGETKTIVYNLGNLSPDLNMRLSSMGASGSADQAQAEDAMLAVVGAVVERWDLTDEEGDPLPVNKKGARKLSYRLLTEITVGIMSGAGNEEGEEAAPEAVGAPTEPIDAVTAMGEGEQG